MKKSWLKSLLIIVMAVLLVVGLVACDDGGKDDPKDGTYKMKASDYFTKMWDLTSKIGATKIEATSDLAAEVDMSLTIETRQARVGTLVQQMDLGFNIQAVLGRTTDTASNTALKVKIYDPTDAAHEEIATLYLFANDIDNLYVDFGGLNIKVPHEVVKLVWKDIMGSTDELNSVIPALLDKGLFGADKDSINDVINGFVGKFGDNWNLNTLINGILDMTGFDLKAFLNGDSGARIRNLLSSMLKMQPDDLFDSNGNFNLIDVLKSDIMGDAFAAQKTIKGGVTQYKASLASNFVGMVSGIVGGLLGNSTNYGEINLLFDEVNGEIDGFAINAVLAGMATTGVSFNGREIEVVPSVTLKINELKLENATATNKVKTKKAPADYKTNVAVNEKLSVAVSGIKVKTNDLVGALSDDVKELLGIAADKTFEDFNIEGKVEVQVLGQLDIVNVTDNQTKLNVIVKLNDSVLATASLVNNRIAAQLTGDPIDFQGEKIKGIVYSKEVNIAQIVRTAITDLVEEWGWTRAKFDNWLNASAPTTPAEPEEPTPGETDPTPEEPKEDKKMDRLIGNVIGFVQVGLRLASTSNGTVQSNDITISTQDILATIVAFANKYTGYDAENAVKVPNSWTVEERESIILASLTQGIDDTLTFADCVDYLVVTVMSGNIDDIKNMDMSYVVTALSKLAEFVEIEGVEATELALLKTEFDEVEGKWSVVIDPTTKRPVKEEARELTAYEAIIYAGLHSSISVNGDAKNGFHFSASATVGDATLTITESLEVVETTNETFVDVYDVYSKLTDAEKEQWISLPMQQA